MRWQTHPDRRPGLLRPLVGANAEELYVSRIESDEIIKLSEYLENTKYSIVDGKILIMN